jgi:olfactory receptor
MKIGIGVLTRAGLSIMPIIVRLHWFPYCWSRVLSHAFCLHQDVIKLACGDTTFNRLYPVVVAFAMGLLDCLMIFSPTFWFSRLSWALLLEKVPRPSNTRVSHICCILVFYITVVGLTFIHRFGQHAPHVVHITISYIYFLFPPLMNPVIYSIKTKQIQSGILRLFSLPCFRATLWLTAPWEIVLATLISWKLLCRSK